MSLVRAALRLSAIHALRGRTAVVDNILDSEIGSLDQNADGSLRTKEDGPFVSVYLYDSIVKPVSGKSLVEHGETLIAFEYGVTVAMTQTNEDGESEIVGMGLPATDSSLELHLDFLGREIRDALVDDRNEWGQIFLGLAGDIVEARLLSTRSADNGMRLAGHQLLLTLKPIDDPVAGEPLDEDTALGRFITALEAVDDRDTRIIAQRFRALVEQPPAADWQILQRRMGMTAAELLALGRGPVSQDEERSTPFATEFAVDVDGIGGEAVAARDR